MTKRRQDIERRLIGAILVGAPSLKRYRWMISPELFSGNGYAEKVRQCLDLLDRGIEPNIENAVVDVSKSEWVDIFAGGSVATDIGEHIRLLIEEIVRERLTLKETDDIFKSISERSKLLDEVHRLINTASDKSNVQMLEDYIEYVENHNSGVIYRIPTPFPQLNRLCKGGLKSGGYSFVGGEPGAGKTSLMIQLGLYAAQKGYSTYFIEGEMPADEIYERAFGITMDRDIDDVFKDSFIAMPEFTQKMHSLPFRVKIVSERTPETLANAVQHGISTGAKLIIIDYLQVFALKGAEEIANIKVISEMLRGKSLQHPIHICVGSSLVRSSDAKGMARFYGGSQLMHDCTTALLLEGEQADNEIMTGTRSVKLLVPKNRGGAITTGGISLEYNLRKQKFREVFTGVEHPEPAPPQKPPVINDELAF